MKKFKFYIKSAILLVFFLSFISQIYALGSLAIMVNTDKTSLDLVHGTSATITFTITGVSENHL